MNWKKKHGVNFKPGRFKPIQFLYFSILLTKIVDLIDAWLVLNKLKLAFGISMMIGSKNNVEFFIPFPLSHRKNKAYVCI